MQGKGGSKHNITKNVDLRKTFENGQTEEKLIHKNPILSAVIKNHLQSYDPRSPTQDFERTPIVIGENLEEMRNDKNALRAQNVDNYGSPCLRNDEGADESFAFKEANLDIVPKNLCNLTFNESIKEVEEPLGSSTASSDSIKKDSSNDSIDRPTKLLETNFDYDETLEKSLDDVEENNQSNTITKPNNDKSATSVSYIPKFKILPEDPRSPTNGIERTPIVVAKIQEESTDDNVEDMSDDTLIKVLQHNNEELIHSMTKPQGKKSDEILIYEDEGSSLNDTPKKCRSANSNGSRTPLSCMKNKADAVHSRSKSANTLYDPKSQHNGAKKVSHIPRLKSLSKQNTFVPTASSISLRNISKATGIIGDCENTPPHSHRDKWDKDTSIIL